MTILLLCDNCGEFAPEVRSREGCGDDALCTRCYVEALRHGHRHVDHDPPVVDCPLCNCAREDVHAAIGIVASAYMHGGDARRTEQITKALYHKCLCSDCQQAITAKIHQQFQYPEVL